MIMNKFVTTLKLYHLEVTYFFAELVNKSNLFSYYVNYATLAYFKFSGWPCQLNTYTHLHFPLYAFLNTLDNDLTTQINSELSY